MRKMITATGMALLSIGVVATVQAEPVSNAGQVTLAEAAPVDASTAARRKGPKVKVKEISTRVANPPATGAPAADAPIAPTDAPDAARTGRPKERDKEVSTRVANPTPATEPVAQPTEKRRKGPKERDDPVLDTSRTGRPKERDDTPRDTSRTGRPKERDDSPHNRTSLLLPALSGAAAIAAIIVATSGNDRPTSP
jgi:hypothetical protein